MINKIGLGYNLGVRNIIFKGEESVSKPDELSKDMVTNFPQKNLGLDALAAYNSAIVKKPDLPKNSFDIEPLEPIIINPEDVEKMEGERIYSSNGKLNSIVRRDENIITVFTPSEDNDNMFSSIQKFDKKSGRGLVFLQENYIGDGKYSVLRVAEFDPKTGKECRSSVYIDGKLDHLSKTTIDKNGKEQYISYDCNDKSYYVNTSLSNGSKELIASFDENKKLIEFSDYSEQKGYKSSTNIQFYQGAPIKVSVNKEMTMPNTIGWENFVNDDNLKPSAHFDKIENIKEIEGERTYYSNGALESNKFISENGETIAYFRPEGSCSSIKSDTKELYFDDAEECIKEKLDDNSVKITRLLESGVSVVRLENGNIYKEICYSVENKPSSYYEGIISEDGDRDGKCLYFDKNGMLEYGRDYKV